MSDQEVDLNALIQSDRKKRWNDKEKRKQQHKRQRNQRYDSRRDNGGRDRSRDNRRDDRQEREDRGGRRKAERPARQLVVQSYAISATGFVSDVSLDDILKLAKGKKIINIKAFLQRQDGDALVPGQDNAMTVIINFVQKQDASQFIKEYADKKLDGKTPLEFQFRRGMVSRRPQPRQNEGSQDEGNEKSGKRKQEEEENQQKN